jgi:hypothetical protein
MDLRATIFSARAAWSDAYVIDMARKFLAECRWALEAGDGLIDGPVDVELQIRSAAIILSDQGFGDHVEAIVYLGADGSPPHDRPLHGALRLYLDAEGRMITEDRYSPAEWRDRRA